jgi:aspartate/methionine/tyrosine aminotransferase
MFLIFDEIYEKLTYNDEDRVLLSDIIWDVPGISMKWISKDLPWPGSRCGWIEIYNENKDKNFKKYTSSILASKLLEVCSTTLPQFVLPEIYENKNYKISLMERIEKYQIRADLAEKYLWNLEEVTLIKPKWAFYLSIAFNIDNLNKNFVPEIKNDKIIDIVKEAIKSSERFDKKFCYYMLWKTWICSVPLSWFNSTYEWFRITLLEEDENKFIDILSTIRNFIIEFKK